MNREPLIVALDLPELKLAQRFVEQLGNHVLTYKVGLQLFTQAGPDLLRYLQKQGHRVFLDLKFHDIPNTVVHAVTEATRHGVFMLTVHALGGREMLQAATTAAREAAQRFQVPAPKILAVTILTSHADLQDQGSNESIPEAVERLALLAQKSGCDGGVCSPQEIARVRQVCGPNFLIVTPGIRLSDTNNDDQKRIATPQAALRDGANYIVVGRPILQAEDPPAIVQAIMDKL